MPSPSHSAPQVLHKPASGRFIAFGIVLALLLNLIPWGGAARLLHPDFVALAILYWVVHQPLRVGMGASWFLGLLMDVADGALFGQHALAYSIAAYIALKFHRRILMFTPLSQALYIFGLLLTLQVVMLLIRLFAGAAFPGMGYFLASASGALVWPLLNFAMQLPQRRKISPDATFSAGHK